MLKRLLDEIIWYLPESVAVRFVRPFRGGGGSNLDLEGTRLGYHDRTWVDSQDVNVSSVNLDDDFIYAGLVSAGRDTTVSIILQWQDVTDASAWTTLGGTGEVTYNGVTDLVNGTACTSDEWGCDPSPADTPIDGKELEGTGNTGAVAYLKSETAEHQWAIDFSNADSGHEYGFRLWDTSASAAVGTGITVTVYPSVGVTHELAGTIPGTASTTGLANLLIGIVGDITALTTLTGDLSLPIIHLISGSITGTGTTQARIDLLQEIAGSIDAATTLDGKLVLIQVISGSLAALSNVVGDLIANKGFAGNIAALTTLDGELQMIRSIVASIDATTQIDGKITADLSLGGTIPAVSSITGILDIVGQVFQELAGVISATSSSDAELSIDLSLSGIIDGTTTIAGALDIIGQVFKELAGTIDGTSSLDASLIATKNLAGNIDSVSVVNGELIIAGAEILLAGVVTATSNADGTLVIERPLSGAIDSVTAFEIDISREIGLQGTIDALAEILGNMGVDFTLGGDISIQSSLTGAVSGVGVEIILTADRRVFVVDKRRRGFTLDAKRREFTIK